MGNIFRLDSPVMKILTLAANLVCLNILWLLCSLPIVTAGASTAAMYYVVFQYINDQDDAVLKPFLKAFKENFRTATLVWMLNLLIGLALAAGILYLSQGGATWFVALVMAVTFIYLGATSYLYPMIARYDVPVRTVVGNSFALSTRHLFSTALMVSLNALPVVLGFFAPNLFLHIGVLWMLGGFSLVAYLNGRILIGIFRKYEQNTQDLSSEETTEI